MAFTSIFGIQSGFDSASLVEKLIALQARPMDLKLAQLKAKETQLDAFQQLRDHLQAFQAGIKAISTVEQFSRATTDFTVTSGTGSVLTATPSSAAQPGTFNIIVNSLAQEATLLSDTGYNSPTDVVPQGVFGDAKVEVIIGGAINEVDITNTATVQDVVDAVNNSGLAVTASIINDGSATNPLKIQIQGNQSGTANSVSARVFRDFIILPDVTDVTFTTTQTASDASVTVDGVTYTRSSNSISDVIPGVNLQLESLGSGILTITEDTSVAGENIIDFVDAFNKLTAFIDEQTAFNPQTFNTGTLFANSAVQSLESNLRRIATGRVTGVSGSFEFLSQIGITTQDNGQLVLDEVKLNNALAADRAGVLELFTSSGTATDANVTFVGFTNNTVAGTYDVRVQGGVPQLSPAGAGTFVDAVDNGSFFSGAPGTAAEGLSFSLASMADGNYGTITLSLGVIPRLNQEISTLLDSSQKGPLTAELDSLTGGIDDLNDTLLRMDERLELFEKNIRQQFINLEIILGRLDAQRNSFQQALQGLGNLFNQQA